MKAMVFNLQWLTLDCFYSITKIFLQNTLFPILGPLGKVHLEADALFFWDDKNAAPLSLLSFYSIQATSSLAYDLERFMNWKPEVMSHRF